MIDSLDLNIGYESIQKLKDGWGFGAAAKPKPLPENKTFNYIPAEVKPASTSNLNNPVSLGN